MNTASKGMLGGLFSGFTFWLLVAALAAYLLFPIEKSLKFGIDLAGGTYITLKVETQKAVDHELREQAKHITSLLKNDKMPLPKSSKVNNGIASLVFDSESDASKAVGVVRDAAQKMKVGISGKELSLTLTGDTVSQLESWALESNINVLRTRLNKLGVEEIKITAQGNDSIVVELPNVDDPAKAKKMIGTPAMLEFKVVEESGGSHEELLEEYGGELPEGMVVVANRDSHGDGNRFLLVPDHAEVTGRYLREAMAVMDQAQNQMAVSFRFTPEGGDRFHELTSENVNRSLAAILDNQAISVANISGPIRSNVQISGGGITAERATELADLLKSGAFVAPVSFSEERRVGPSLGADSIKGGLMACLVGLGLLLLFSVFYYKLFGIFAFLALIFNLLLVLLALSLTGAALTLPGIAGMVLTVGMAIDASVLIYERIKELLADGKSAKLAVQEGFANAMVVILDGNITTFIVGIVLFKFGTGPIQGFAVTMMIGIISTLITGLFFLRSMINFVLDKQNVQKLSI